jgi:hypothetical protein
VPFGRKKGGFRAAFFVARKSFTAEDAKDAKEYQ